MSAPTQTHTCNIFYIWILCICQHIYIYTHAYIYFVNYLFIYFTNYQQFYTNWSETTSNPFTWLCICRGKYLKSQTRKDKLNSRLLSLFQIFYPREVAVIFFNFNKTFFFSIIFGEWLAGDKWRRYLKKTTLDI